MLPLQAVKTVIVHGGCPDGLASALIINEALPGRDIRFLQHDEPGYQCLPVTSGMLFCDIAPPRERVQEFVDADAIVLDHHKHAEELVRRFSFGVFADEVADPGVSGALLAWRHVAQERGHDQTRTMAVLAGIRDTWQTDNPLWFEAAAQAEALMFFGWEELKEYAYVPVNCMAVGELLFKKQLALAEDEAKKATIVGRVAIFNDRYSSDVAEALRHSRVPVDLAVGFKYVGEADRSMSLVFSLRAIADVDVGAIAKANGGGGHTKAAGFAQTNVAMGYNPISQFYIALCLAKQQGLMT